MLNELLFSGGVRLTINGSNLNLVEQPKMNVSLIFSFGGVLVPNYTVTVTRQTYWLGIVDLHSKIHCT